MRQLQALLKAIMLRRKKDSQIDGKPILELPPKTEHSEDVHFSVDEAEYYENLETRSRVLFSKYLRAGTVGKNYSNVLVLLLRLRQACCHPHLTTFECVSGTNITMPSGDDAEALAKQLDESVVTRIKQADGSFECPICYEPVPNPTFVIPCGHDTCSECFASLTDAQAQNNIQAGDDNSARGKCPQCRGPIDPQKIIDYMIFQKVFMPEKLAPDDSEENDTTKAKVSIQPEDGIDPGGSGSDTASDTASESDDESERDDEVDENGNLKGFVVDDSMCTNNPSSAETDSIFPGPGTSSANMQGRKKRNGKKGRAMKRSSKGRGKTEEVQPTMLQQLRLDGQKNK